MVQEGDPHGMAVRVVGKAMTGQGEVSGTVHRMGKRGGGKEMET